MIVSKNANTIALMKNVIKPKIKNLKSIKSKTKNEGSKTKGAHKK